MLQYKTINDMTKDQKEKMYLYFHQKIFNKDSQSELLKRREIIEDNFFHDIVMEMLNSLLEEDSDTDVEEDTECDENIVYGSDIKPDQKIKVVYDINNNLC